MTQRVFLCSTTNSNITGTRFKSMPRYVYTPWSFSHNWADLCALYVSGTRNNAPCIITNNSAEKCFENWASWDVLCNILSFFKQGLIHWGACGRISFHSVLGWPDFASEKRRHSVNYTCRLCNVSLHEMTVLPSCYCPFFCFWILFSNTLTDLWDIVTSGHVCALVHCWYVLPNHINNCLCLLQAFQFCV